MSDSPSAFRPSYLKIERAKRHFDELHQVAQEYLATNPVTVSTREYPGGFAFTMDVQGAPEVMSAILGDIFHNLRSSLDLMAAALVRANGKPDDDVYFPFSGNEADLDLMIKRRNFDRAGDAAVKLLKETRPYKGGNLALRAVHDLNIYDKHRALIVNSMQIASPVIDTRPEGGGAPRIVGDPNKPSEMNLVFPEVAGLGGREVFKTLEELVEAAARVVESFEPLVAPAG